MAYEIHSHMHCRTCFGLGQTERLQVGLTRKGIQVNCPKHGEVAHFTPEQLQQQVARGAQCDCCPGGMHSN